MTDKRRQAEEAAMKIRVRGGKKMVLAILTGFVSLVGAVALTAIAIYPGLASDVSTVAILGVVTWGCAIAAGLSFAKAATAAAITAVYDSIQTVIRKSKSDG